MLTGLTGCAAAAAPTPAPSPQSGCDVLFTASQYETMAAEGRVQDDPFPLARLFPPIRKLALDGGTACSWTSGSKGELYILIARSSLDQSEADELMNELALAGWVHSDTPIAGVLIEADHEGPAPMAALYVDGAMYIANSPEFLGYLAITP